MSDESTLAIQVDGRVLRVHASVLAAHSGYFKAAMLSGRWPASLALPVPFVPAAVLVRLVHFMYTQQLDVDAHNVNDVLVAAHLLRIPRAVDACQEYLFRMAAPWRRWLPSSSSFYPVLDWTEATYRPPPPPDLYVPVPRWPQPIVVTPEPYLLRPTEESIEAAAAAAATPGTPDTERNQTVVTATSPSRETEEAVDREENENENEAAATSGRPTVQVVIDVAWCDGPVRFQRVLNESCALVSIEGLTPADPPKRVSPVSTVAPCSSSSSEEADSSGASSSRGRCVLDIRAPTELRARSPSPKDADPPTYDDDDDQVDDISTSSPATDFTPKRRPVAEEAGEAGEAERDSGKSSSSSPPSSYHCKYCGLFFKSHYCYAKHKRRHLDPTAVGNYTWLEAKEDQDGGSSEEPFEFNVPFYPCKTCGSKFPSYYFVHKHRKACHGLGADSTTTAATTEAPPPDGPSVD